MRKLIVLIFLASVTIVGCKKIDDQKTDTSDLEAKLTANLNILRDAAKIYSDALQQSNDSVLAFIEMNNFLFNHPDVSGGTYHNIEYIEVEFANGLRSPINIIPSNNGVHLSRGGGTGSLVSFFKTGSQTQKIKNKKVLILIPYPQEFEYFDTDYTNLENLIKSGSLDMEVDIQVGNQVDVNDISRFSDYGLIILNVHGVKNGFYIAYLRERFGANDAFVPEEIINSAFNEKSIPADKVANGEIQVGLHMFKEGSLVNFRYNVLITEKYIRNLNIDLTDAVLLGNHCYSGHTADGPNVNNMPEAWRSKGLATYYGYADVDGVSAPVINEFCKNMEKALIRNLIVDGDTTGEAHLEANGSEHFYVPNYGYHRGGRPLVALNSSNNPPPKATQVWPLYFRQYFDNNYEYDQCEGEIIDTRDGQRYRTVCIGEQEWMAENLNYSAAGSIGLCYDNNNGNCDVYGRLYSIEELTGKLASSPGNNIKGICPQGWHVPSQDEVQELLDFVGGSGVAGTKLKADTIWGPFDDEYGFSLLPGGQAGVNNSIGGPPTFSNINGRFWGWTSSVYEPISGDDEYIGYYTTNNDPQISFFGVGAVNSTAYYSCRCVKD